METDIIEKMTENNENKEYSNEDIMEHIEKEEKEVNIEEKEKVENIEEEEKEVNIEEKEKEYISQIEELRSQLKIEKETNEKIRRKPEEEDEIYKLQKTLKEKKLKYNKLKKTNEKQKEAIEQLTRELEKSFKKETKKNSDSSNDKEKPKNIILEIKDKDIDKAMEELNILKKENQAMKEDLEKSGDYNQKIELEDNSKEKKEIIKKLNIELKLLDENLKDHQICEKEKEDFKTAKNQLKDDIKNAKDKNKELNEILKKNEKKLQILMFGEKKNEENDKNNNVSEEKKEELNEEYKEEEEKEDNENDNKSNESENNGFKIKFYKGKIDDLIQIIKNPNNNYINSIQDFQLTSFNITEKSFEYNNLTSGIFPKIIISLYENEIKGLCKISFSSLNKPITIKLDHLSSIDVNENLNKWALQIHLIMKFIYKNIEFNEIEFIIENTMSENIYYLFTENFGFKLISEDNKNKFKLYNTDNEISDNSNFFSFNSLSLITFSLMKSFNESEIEKFINLFNILCIISKEKSFGLIKTEILNSNIFELNINDIEKILGKSLELIIQCSGLDYVKQFIDKTLENEIYLDDLLYNGRDDCDIITYKLIYSFSNVITIKYHKTYYNRINSDIEMIYNKIHKNNIYLIPTNNTNIYLIIVEINKKFNEQIIQKNNNLYESVYTILKENYNNKKTLNKNIYIPSFNINRHLKQEGLNEITNKIKITKSSGSNIYISMFNEFYNIIFNNDKYIGNNFKVNINKDDIVIKESFLFGIYYKNMFETNNIPIVALYMITKFYWNTIYN